MSTAPLKKVSSPVADNAIRYTRTAEDDQGSAYSPTRTAVLVFAGAGHTVAGNTVTVHGEAQAFITNVRGQVRSLVDGLQQSVREGMSPEEIQQVLASIRSQVPESAGGDA